MRTTSRRMRRTAAVTASIAASAVLALGALAGCAADPDGTTDPGSTAAPGEPGSGELPQGDDLAAWADGAIPENQLGGADYTVREVGTVRPGDQIGLDLGDLDGAATLSIACLTPESGEISVRVEAPGDSGTDVVPCSPLDSPAGENPGIIPVSDVATVAVSSETEAVFVYTVTPVTGTR